MRMLEAIHQWEAHLGRTKSENTLKTNVGCVYQFCIFVRNCDITEVREKDVNDWLDLLEITGHKVATNRIKMSALRQFFDFHYIRDLPVLHPRTIDIPKKKHERKRVMNEEIHQQLLRVANERDKMVLHMLKDTGARIGELVSLDVGTLDLYRRFALIMSEKTRSQRPYRKLKWTRQTNELLREFVTGRNPHEPLFVTIRAPHKRLLAQGFRLALKRYCALLGFDYIANPHSYRHWLAHRMVLNGASLLDIALVLGHRDVAHTQEYLDLYSDEMGVVYERSVERHDIANELVKV